MQKKQITISEDTFKLWFKTPLTIIVSSNLPVKESIEKLYDTIYFIDAYKATEYYKYAQEHFINNLLNKNLFCVLLLNYLLKKQKFSHLNNDFKKYVFSLNKQLEIADNMFWGVFELAKNIVDHAKIKVNEKWEKTVGNITIENTTKSALKKDTNNSIWKEYWQCLENKGIKTKSFLRISLGDNGEKGIIETTLEYMSEESKYRDIPEVIKKQDGTEIIKRMKLCENKADETRLLFDMYFSGRNSFLTRQHKHALKGIGLYKFTKFLSKSNGFLNVQTNKYQNKNDIIAFSLFDTLEPKSPLVQSNLFGFSDYHIILPLQSLTSEKQNKENQESNNEKHKIEGQELPNSVYRRMLSLETDLNKDGNIFNFEDDFNVEYSEYVIREKGKNSNIYVCSFSSEIIKDIDISPLFRSISKLIERNNFEANLDKEFIVVRNLSESSINRVHELYDISDENIESDKNYFYKNKILLLLTNKNVGIVIAGNTKEKCLKINRYLKQNNSNFDVKFNLLSNDNIDILTKEETTDIDEKLSPLFVKGQFIELDAFEYNKEKTITLFENKTKKQLEKEIDTNNGIGYNWKETHLKIGSKLHLRDFVYGKKMFQRSDKASTFAFLLAKDIFKNIKPTIDTTIDKRIIYTLVGYGYYSELMVSRICDFIKKLLKLNNITLQKTDVEYVIVEDEDEIKFSRYFHNLQNRTNTLEKLLVIVPISSTLTTCLKIENTFYNILKTKLKEDKYKNYTNKNFKIEQPFYTTIIVGDEVEETDLEQLSERLKDKKGTDYETIRSVWRGINVKKKRIFTTNREKHKKRKNHYNIYIPSKWQLPYNCEYCFPYAPIQERPVFVTDKVSVTPSLIFETSEWYNKGNNNIEYNEPCFKFKEGESRDAKNTELPILDKIHWVHYKGDGNKHFNYYFNYLDFVKKNENKLVIWLSGDKAKKQKSQFIVKDNFTGDKNKRILLIAPDKAENGRFIHIINREIFDDRASVIRFDKHSDHYLNFGKFFGKDIKQADSIYFVDNLMLSGKTFFSIDEILKTAQQNSNEENKQKIKGIFSLVNRMDYSCFNAVIDKLQSNNLKKEDNDSTKKENNNKNLPYFYSFLQLNVLESIVFPCPLCEEEKKYKKLRDDASLDCIKEYFFKKEMPDFEEISREKLLECDFSYQPPQKKKSSTLLQSAIIHFLNKAVSLSNNKNDTSSICFLNKEFESEGVSVHCLQKTTLPDWNKSNDYKEYINFNGFVKEFREFITNQKQCDDISEDVINDLKFKSNLIKILSGQFCKKYRGIYIAVFYWVLCELIVAARTLQKRKDSDIKYVDILAEKENLDKLTDFTILTVDSFSTANEIHDFIDKTNYLRLLIKYASSLNIAYLLHEEFLAAINKFVNRRDEIKNKIQLGYKSLENTSERKDLHRKYKENQYAFEDFKVFCAAHISRSLYENQQRAIKFEQNLNQLYNDDSIIDKTFLELLLLENTSIIRQTLLKIKNEENLKNDNPLLDDYRKFNIDRDENEMFGKIRLANELQRDLNKGSQNDGNYTYTENEEKDNLKKIAKIVGCNIENGGGILLYKYQNIDKEQINKTENYCVIGKCGGDSSLANYFEDNAESNSFTANFLEGITYLSESNDDNDNKPKYKWTSYALHKKDNEWKGQSSETEITDDNNQQQKYSDFSDIQMLTNKANRILFIRISSYDNKILQGEAVFVFYDNSCKYDEKGNTIKPDSVHDTRFIHVLRNNISSYLKDKYSKDAFKAWVEERKFLNAPDHNYYNILGELKKHRNNKNKFEFLYTLLMVKKEMYEILKTKKIKANATEILDFDLKEKIKYICSNMFGKKIPDVTGDSCIIRFHEPFFRHVMYEYLYNARKGAATKDIKINVSNDNNGKYEISIENKHAYVDEDKNLLQQKERLLQYGYADSSKIKGLYLNSLLLEAIGCSAPSIKVKLNNDITIFTVIFTLKNL